MNVPRGIDDSRRVTGWTHAAGPGGVVVVRGLAEDPLADLCAGVDRGPGFSSLSSSDASAGCAPRSRQSANASVSASRSYSSGSEK